jgi:CheY-like chemotaxis protein/3-methyladenine DNA glycosylase AlkD
MQKTVLVVDDERIIRDVYKRKIEQLTPYEVLTVRSGVQALKVIGEQRVDLLTCDLSNGEMSGLQLLAALAERYPALPVFVISASITETDEPALLALGARRVLPKPLDPRDLVQELSAVLDPPRRAQALPGGEQKDPRLLRLRELLLAEASPADAKAQQRYHKSALQFMGLKAAAHARIFREVFPPRSLSRAEHLPLAQAMWRSTYFDERVAALWLLERLVKELTPGDLAWLKGMTRDCDGWALTDYLTTRTLGALALRHGAAVYQPVRGWSDDDWLWTRRAAILIHALPARKGALAHEYAWPTFEERLGEKEFFIRKAIGWALRECAKHYPREVHGFLTRVGDRASGLTRREGARNLPEDLRVEILGK